MSLICVIAFCCIYLFFFKTLIVTIQGRKKSLVFCWFFFFFFLQINVLILWSFVKMFRVMSLLQLVLKWGVTHEPFVAPDYIHNASTCRFSVCCHFDERKNLIYSLYGYEIYEGQACCDKNVLSSVRQQTVPLNLTQSFCAIYSLVSQGMFPNTRSFSHFF